MTVSLRTRLLSWFGLVLFVLIFAVTFLAHEIVVWNMEEAIDDTLQKRVHMIAAIVSSDITTDEASYAQVISDLTKQELPFVPLLLRVTSPKGKTIVEFGEVPVSVVDNLNRQLQLVDSGSKRLDTIMSGNGTPLRVYTVSVNDPRTGEVLALVQDAESLEQLEQTKRQLWYTGAIAALCGTLLALVIGLVLMQRWFSPLRAIIRAIDEFDYSHLKSRLEQEARPAELEQLAKSLMAMWRRLDTALSERQESLARVSHDLRTPLTALQGHLEVLLLQPSLSKEVKDSLEQILRETRRLARLVKNLLLNVQLEAKPAIATEEVNLGDLIDEVVADVWTLAGGLEFQVVAPRDLTVFGDHDLLKQMLLNIVDNAIKFTPKGGQIKLTVASEGDWVVLDVSDTGQGIPSQDLPHVTQAFYRSKISKKAGAVGAGLGLSIVKQIVELHGGELGIQSQEGAGTSVKVRLPTKLAVVLS